MHFDRNIDSRSPLLTSDMNKHIRRSTAEVNICQQCKDPRAGTHLQTSLNIHQQKKEKPKRCRGRNTASACSNRMENHEE